MSPLVGIDLGTTNSLCAVFSDGAPRIIPNALDQPLTPSVVAVMDDGKVITGAAAREYRVLHPDSCASRFKQWMGTDHQVRLGKREFSPPELSSLILRSLKEDAERFLGANVTEAVVTVPAYFNDKQRRATKLAGQLAGLTVRRIINEPTAAALTYGLRDKHSEKHIIVLDLGGGTFDVTLMEVFDGSMEIVATAGENFLGGEEFTDRLTATVFERLGTHMEKAELSQPLQVARVRQSCEMAKRQLYEKDRVALSIPGTDGVLTDDAQEVWISRSDFEKLSRPLFDRLQGPIHKVLRDGDQEPDQIEEVILVGGATRMVALRQFVADQLECQPRCEFNPDEVVALGAAIQAALIQDDAAVEDMVMTDVCPHTLGVETVREFGTAIRDGYYHPVIHRNTTIPVSREQTLYTIYDNQSEVILRVFQGESRRVSENTPLGQLSVNHISPRPAGTPIVVRFSYDLNGILEVEAFVEDSQERFTTVITSEQDLTDAEIALALSRLQEIKFYPRDDDQNRHLLHFAERIVGEVNPLMRQQLDEAVDTFERSMSAGDPEWFEHSKSALIQTLASLGFPFVP